ncbi:MAG: PAS domain S-box protein [Candidatus Obscuribacterales bacterium]|nr:PAS domain S-box protein [Candidatus Obscuribacterales bacterium]
MKLVNLKLSHKGLILVAVPLVCELIFLITLSVLLYQAEAAAAQEANSKSIIFEADLVAQKFLRAGTFLFLYKNTGNPTFEKEYYRILKQLPSECDSLKARTANQPKQHKVAEHIEILAEKTTAILHEIGETMEEGVLPSSNFMHMIDLNKELESALSEITVGLHELVSAEAKIVRSNPNNSKKFRFLVQQCIAAGVVLNIAIALGLASYFNASTIRRLRLLMENTLLLSKEQPLMPALEGADEIAQLDRSFHEMAQALHSAQEKERSMYSALQTSEERIRKIVASMPVGLVIADNAGNIELVNERIHEMFGYDKEELIGKPVAALCTPTNTSDSSAWLQMLKQRSNGKTVEIETQRKNGDTIAIDVSIENLNENDNRRLLINIMDATERHVIEKLKRELVAVVSHDLRTPLTSIQMNLGFMLAGGLGPLTDKSKSILESSERQVNRLIKLVKDLLDIEKIESGTIDLQFRKMTMGSMITQAIEAVSSVAADKNITIGFAGDTTEISADEDRLMQVMINLLSNAIKYSHPNSTIQVQTEMINDFLETRIIDQGQGIPDSHKDLIFERFQQVDGKRDQKEKGGTGLGLAICKALIQQHGGFIGVESTEGKGSTFWFRLPLTEKP